MCESSGMCASKRMGYGKVLTDEEVLTRFTAAYSSKEYDINRRIAFDLGREKEKEITND